MKRSLIMHVLPFALWASTPGAAAVELLGTPHSLIYRGPATALAGANPGEWPQVRVTPGGFRFPASPPQVPRGTLVLMMASQELARARFDPQLDGFFFQMPRVQGLGAEPACLYIRGADGRTLPLRAASGTDDGYEFRHTPWEQGIRASSSIVMLTTELDTLNKRAEAEDREIGELELSLNARGGAAPPACVAGPEQSPPPQPAWAIPEDAALPHARHYCGLAVGTRLQAMRQARMSAQEVIRIAGILQNPTPSSLPAPPNTALQIPLSDDQLVILQKGLQMGQRSLEYEQGLESVRTAMNTCMRGMSQFSAAETARWAKEKDAAVRAPETARLTCERHTARLMQLRDGVVRRNAFRQAIISRLDSARAAASATSRPPERLESSACQSRN